MDFSTIEITSKKVHGNNLDFSIIEITWIFRPSKLHGFFDQRNYSEKSTWKQHVFFDQRNYVEKGTWKRGALLDQKNYIEKVRGNDVETRRNLVFDVST